MDIEEFRQKFEAHEPPPTYRPVEQISTAQRIRNMLDSIRRAIATVFWAIIGLMALGILVRGCVDTFTYHSGNRAGQIDAPASPDHGRSVPSSGPAEECYESGGMEGQYRWR